MRIACEAPLILMDVVRSYTHYDYYLAHLFSNSEYLEQYFKSQALGRPVYLDNSLFELGYSVSNEELNSAATISTQLPDAIFAPDVIHDGAATVKLSTEWLPNAPSVSKIFGICQGKSRAEAVDCIKGLVEAGINNIAIVYGGKFLGDNPYETGRYVEMAQARVEFLESVVDLIPGDIHLLGCWVPQEMKWYDPALKSRIVSVDTSHPVVHGLYGLRYDNNGLQFKIPTKVTTDYLFFQKNFSLEQVGAVNYNLNRFLEWCL